MEEYDVRDENGNLLGYTKIRGYERNPDEHILGVHLWIINSNGKFLLQQRSKNKTAPGRWTPLTGGVEAGETSLEALKRELKEEYNLNLEDFGLKFINRTLPSENWAWIYDLYAINADLNVNDINFNKDDIDNLKYFSLEEINQLYEDGESLDYRANYHGYTMPSEGYKKEAIKKEQTDFNNEKLFEALNKFKTKCNEFGIFTKANIINLKNPKDLLSYMTNNLTYGFVSKDNHKYTDPFSKDWQNNWYDKCLVQTGKEVLETKIGTCWDQVELERLWFKNHNYKFKTIFMWFEVNKENNLPTHTCLIYEENNKYYWFENAFEANRGIHEFNSFKEAVEYIKQEQLNYTVANKLGTKGYLNLLKVYEYDELTKSLSVQEYLDHVTKKVI